ncbi:MAG: ribose 5-phosphate isomerase B [Ignavibacteriaceae bacterium]|nr:ribose 5-phosphate isomerase B [Ignavibacteriaceae bacterium]
MKISLSADHAGFRYKEKIKKYLADKGIEIIDRGTFSEDSVDYPDFVQKSAADVINGKADLGIGVCGSGIGVSISANKVKGIRAALVLNEEMASLSRKHNNSNFLALSQKFIDENHLFNIVDTWLATEFEGGRHQRRIDKLEQI